MTVHEELPVKPFRIIPCNEWGARPPRHPIVDAGEFDKTLFHHTAGHHREFVPPSSGESYAEAREYARAIQLDHLARDGGTWADTGNNFLITRNGYIFEGRHRSLELLAQGHCPISAHCPGQNGNPGVEHEHLDTDVPGLTPIQYEASVWLFAKICRNGGFGAGRIHGHRDYWATACPGELEGMLPGFRRQVDANLNGSGKPKPVPYRTPIWFVDWAKWWLHGGDPDTRPSAAPQTIPERAFTELDKIIALGKEKP